MLVPLLIPTATGKLPHILFIIADDLGWNDMGFMNGGHIKTPNVNDFARDGVILDQYYVQSVCSPTRASFLTGRYPLHHTVNNWLKPGEATALPDNETTLATMLTKAGYTTHAIGKWHLGYHTWEHTPTFRGFHSFFGFYSGSEDYTAHKTVNGYDLRREGEPDCGESCSRVSWEDKGRYSTHMFTREAVNIIEAYQKGDPPLFLYVSYQAVHKPSQVPDSYAQRYSLAFNTTSQQVFAGMVSCMDEGVGNITNALRKMDMFDNTVIVFTTDNGGPALPSPGNDNIGSSNWPLRGGKHSIWEGGTRGVAVLWAGNATGLMDPGRRGTKAHQLMHAVDWLPTFCKLSGVADACARLPVDGVDQSRPLFENGPPVREDIYYGQPDVAAKPGAAIRDRKGWKLILGDPGQPSGWSPGWARNSTLESPSSRSRQRTSRVTVQLFNVLTDPEERAEVSNLYPDVVERLKKRLFEIKVTATKGVVGGGEIADPKCPASLLTHRMGSVIEPWCVPSNWKMPSRIFEAVGRMLSNFWG